MVRRNGLVWAIIGLGIITVAAQTPKQSFEVASIKKRDQAGAPIPVRLPPRSPAFYMANATVASLIQFAYNIRDFQMEGGPEWIHRDQFEINARAATEASNDEKRVMVQSLLADRFGLVVHKEPRNMRFSALVLARSDGRLGPKLRACADAKTPPTPVLWPRGGRVSVECGPISVIVNMAAGILRMPVVDHTGLTGVWYHELVFAEPQLNSADSAASRAALDLPSFTTAVQEQLGLKLESRTGPIDVLIVDSVAPPTEN